MKDEDEVRCFECAARQTGTEGCNWVKSSRVTVDPENIIYASRSLSQAFFLFIFIFIPAKGIRSGDLCGIIDTFLMFSRYLHRRVHVLIDRNTRQDHVHGI